MANSAAFLFHMAAASSTNVEGNECMEEIQTRTEKLDISNPVEEKPVRENLGNNNESQQCDEVHDETAQPENTRNTDVEADEGMEDIQADTEEFRPADPQGEEPVRWDFDDVDESRAGIEILVEFNHSKGRFALPALRGRLSGKNPSPPKVPSTDVWTQLRLE